MVKVPQQVKPLVAPGLNHAYRFKTVDCSTFKLGKLVRSHVLKIICSVDNASQVNLFCVPMKDGSPTLDCFLENPSAVEPWQAKQRVYNGILFLWNDETLPEKFEIWEQASR